MKRDHTPRHQFGAPQELWDAFKALHGRRNASARIRELIERDIAHHRDHTFSIRDSRTTPEERQRARGSNPDPSLDNEHAPKG